MRYDWTMDTTISKKYLIIQASAYLFIVEKRKNYFSKIRKQKKH